MFDPYHKWLGIPKDQRPPTHYQLLGIAPGESDPEVIDEAAVRQTAHVRTYQIGQHGADCTRLLNEISVAKMTLLNPAKRKAYDDKLTGARGAQITAAKPPATAVAAPTAPSAPSAFSFDNDAEEPPPLPRLNLNIAKAAKRNAPLWIAVGAGGGGAALVLIVVAVVLAMRSEPIKIEPVAVVKKEDKKAGFPLPNSRADLPPPVAQAAPGNPGNVQEVPIPGARAFKTAEEQIGWLSLSPDGAKVALGFVHASVYDVSTGKKVAMFPPRMGGGIIRTPMAFFPDNQRVLYAYGSDSGTAAVGDSASGATLFHLEQQGVQYASALAVDPAGKRALIGYNYRLVYWDVEAQKEIKSVSTKGIISEVAFLPDGRRAVTGDESGQLDVWELDDLKSIARQSVGSKIKSLAVAPDGVLAAAGFDHGFLTVDWQARHPGPRTFNNDFSGAIAFIAGGTRLLTGCRDGRIVVWDVGGQKTLGAWKGHTAMVSRIAVDAKERIVVSGDASGAVMVWRLNEAGPADLK